jgi:hypothetical protein
MLRRGGERFGRKGFWRPEIGGLTFSVELVECGTYRFAVGEWIICPIVDPEKEVSILIGEGMENFYGKKLKLHSSVIEMDFKK